MPPDDVATAVDTPSAPTTDAPAQTEYAALKAAAAAAFAEAGEGSDAPAAPTPAKDTPAAAKLGTEMGDTPAAPEDHAAADDPEDASLPKLDRLLKAREKARATLDKSRTEAEQLLASARRQAEEDGTRIRKEATDAAKREVQELLGRLKTKPLDAIKEIGWDREQLVNEVSREGTPEYQMMKRLEARAEAAEAKLKEFDDKWGAAEKRNQEAEVRAQHAAIAQTEQKFLATVSLDSAPALRKLYDDAEIIQKGHAAAKRLRDETGQSATLEEIRDHLEYHARKRLEKLSDHETGSTARGHETGPSKSATKQQANGTRTLNGKGQSERRATPKSFREARSPEEETALLREVAAAAMKGDAG
jgi:hypothetical protein